MAETEAFDVMYQDGIRQHLSLAIINPQEERKSSAFNTELITN